MEFVQLYFVFVWFFFSFLVDEEQWSSLWGERNGSAWTSGSTWAEQGKNGLIYTELVIQGL